ncbi:ras-related protein Rab-28-like [Galleria mellonella]|uniref:Ras-related protein Rab-28-like n=1 Tax=Galleria mellonella TaxID=7137 RepID=A0A6J1X6D7_GALME|nr:ras-related protein Rab-28-like [Galleria mellonella]
MSDTEEEEVQSRTVKITVVGEPSTGKTSLCSRYLGGNGAVASGNTQGAEVMAGQCLGLRPPVPVHLCDVGGNALGTTMLRNYLYSSDVVLFVYDLTNLQSFEKLDLWLYKAKEIFESEDKKPIMAIFGNKSDLEHQRAVRLSCVQKFASEHLLENFKGSARTGETVINAFTSLVARVMGLKVRRCLMAVNGYSPVIKNRELNGVDPLPLQSEPTHSLIMNRKALRRIHLSSSSICCLQ